MPSGTPNESGALNIYDDSDTAGTSDSWTSSSDEDWEEETPDQGLAAHGGNVEVVRDYTTLVSSNCAATAGAPRVTPTSKDAAAFELVFGICKVGAAILLLSHM